MTHWARFGSRVSWAAAITAVLAASAACSGHSPTTPSTPLTPSTPALTCGDTPAAGNRILSLFSSPVVGTFPLSNFFDHDLPGVSGNAFQLTFCGERVTGRIDGHQGYDWVMLTGTPLLSVAEGDVTYAGIESPFFCQVLGRTVSDGQFVEVLHPSVDGERFSSVYVHLSRIDVRVGQTVSRGETLGLSGNTGCSTEPHLHLQVWRFNNTNSGSAAVVDPYGWQGQGPDPWSQRPGGSASAWLWKPGEAPLLRPR